MRISDWSSDVCSSDLSFSIPRSMPWSTDRCEPNTARRWLLEVIQGIFKEVFVAGDFTRGVVVIRIGLNMLMSGVLAAGSPQSNWREITVGLGAAKAFFPDTPPTNDQTQRFLGP